MHSKPFLQFVSPQIDYSDLIFGQFYVKTRYFYQEFAKSWVRVGHFVAALIMFFRVVRSDVWPVTVRPVNGPHGNRKRFQQVFHGLISMWSKYLCKTKLIFSYRKVKSTKGNKS